MKTNIFRAYKSLLILILLGICSSAYPGSLNNEMTQMFNDLGGTANITDPGAFRGQAQNIIVGGNITMRSPGKNYQLFNVAGPTMKMGCGGIDAFGGSFSFINKAQLTAMFQNIMSNAVGYFFKLALKSACPSCEGAISELSHKIDALNMNNINSCQAAEVAVNSAFGLFNQNIAQGCRTIQLWFNNTTDYQDSRYDCTQDPITPTKGKTTDPDVGTSLPPDGNIVWQALSKNLALSQDTKEVIMSLIGTIVYKAPADATQKPEITVYPALVDSIVPLLKGDAAGTGPSNVLVTIYRCSNSDCTAMTTPQDSVKPFTEFTREILTSILTKIRGRTAAPSGSEMNFINMTSLPVYKMLAVAAHSGGVGESLIEQYNEPIAIEYAYTFMNTIYSQTQREIAGTQLHSTISADKMKEFMDGVSASKQKIILERQAAMQATGNFVNMANHIATIEGQVKRNTPIAVSKMLNFSSMISK